MNGEEVFLHPAFFYRGPEDFLAGALPFIKEGLEAGDPVTVAVPRDNLEILRTELGEASSHVRFVDMLEAGRNPWRIIPGVLLAVADAYPDAQRVWIVGEPIWPGRSAIEYPACVQHEALINLAFAGRRVTIFCPYDAAGLPLEILNDAKATHPSVFEDGEPRPSPSFATDRILAEFNIPIPDPGWPPLDVSVSSLTDARRIATDHARRAGFVPARVADFELAVSELLTNSLQHGGGSSAFRVWVEDGHLVAEIRDRGHIRDALAGRRPVASYQPQGRGLLLVNKIVDLLRMYTGEDGTTIRIYLILP